MRYAQLLLCTLATVTVFAADATHTRVLIPLASSESAVPGLHGSSWTAQTWLHYTGDEIVFIFPRTYLCVVTCGSGETIFPGTQPRLVRSEASRPAGLFIYLPRENAREFTFQLLLYETSRAFSAAGTPVPVGRDCDFRAAAHLLDVPLVRGTRSHVRVYGSPEAADPVVTIRYFEPPHPNRANAPSVLLREETLRLARDTARVLHGFFLRPAFGVISDLGSAPELLPYESVRIEVAAASPDLRVWALASVTDNETQQVTVIAPQSLCGGE